MEYKDHCDINTHQNNQNSVPSFLQYLQIVTQNPKERRTWKWIKDFMNNVAILCEEEANKGKDFVIVKLPIQVRRTNEGVINFIKNIKNSGHKISELNIDRTYEEPDEAISFIPYETKKDELMFFWGKYPPRIIIPLPSLLC